jgi:hypothetical protein
VTSALARRLLAPGSSVGRRIGPVGVNVLPEIVPFHIPTVSSAVPGSSVAPGETVSTVNVQVPAGKPVTPPAGSMIQPLPSGLVGIDASRVVV